MPPDGGVVLGLLPMLEEPELLAPLLLLVLLDPDVDEPEERAWLSMQFSRACPVRLSQAFAWRSRQLWSAVPVRPEQELVLDAPAEGEPMFDELDPGEDGLAPLLGEPMLEDPIPPLVPCAQANCASAMAETAHALTNIRDVFTICTLLR